MLDKLAIFAAEQPEVVHAAEQTSGGGLSALGLSWQAFLFQLITFVIVLLVLRKFVFGKIVSVLEDRRKAVEESIKHAAETESKLKNAEKTINKVLSDARKQADEVINSGHKEATIIIENAEKRAAKRAATIVDEAKNQLAGDLTQARQQLKAEVASLVALATEQIIDEKLDIKKDAKLIEAALAQEQKKL